MQERMKLLIPSAMLITVLLLYLQFGNFTEVLIVLLSVPFALVGSVWALWLLGFHMSTAVWVGVIALVGLAAQTGVVMIVYIDHAYERRLQAGQIRTREDIIAAHSEGTIARVRPKLMTVGTMLIGLMPLLWAEGSGADVMKRIAAPMVGGLLTSAFLTLEIIPVIYTYWRAEQLLFRELAQAVPRQLRQLEATGLTVKLAAGCSLFASLAPLYLDQPPALLAQLARAALVLATLSALVYLVLRKRATAVRALP
jgi:Cu(I)/Ag(I) efflux system membrane protein CusA/SilA